jgi:hypothetical protein
MKVTSGLLYRVVSLLVEDVRYTLLRRALGALEVARQWLRVESCVYAPSRLHLDSCVWWIAKLTPSRKERACIDLNVSSKYACAIIGIRAG